MTDDPFLVTNEANKRVLEIYVHNYVYLFTFVYISNQNVNKNNYLNVCCVCA